MDAAALFVQPVHLLQAGSAATNAKHEQTGGHNGCHNIKQSTSSYNHPKLTAIMTHLDYEYVEYKYTVYRCASKCVTLQKAFFTSSIPYKLVLAVMERNGIRNADLNLMLPPFQLTSLVHDIYYACEKLGHFTKTPAYNLETSTAVLANFFWNIFDPHRHQAIPLLDIKVTFLLLCKLYNTEQLVTEFYKLFADPITKCISKYSFEYLLKILSKVMQYIGEGNAYGTHNIEIVLNQCFARCHNNMGLAEYQFHSLWTTTQTRFLIYANLIALIKRIEDTEKLIHNNVCASCHREKIIGIRFKCHSCRDLSLCMKCFATGYATNKHESGHRMFECFTEDAPNKKFSHYFARLCNIFFMRKDSEGEEERKEFCNANETNNANETELVTINTHRSSNASTLSAAAAVSAAAMVAKNTAYQKQQQLQHFKESSQLKQLDPASLAGLSTTAANASKTSERLQSIIDRLMLQNCKLEQQLKCVATSTSSEISAFLSAHQQFLKDIIIEMRNISDKSDSAQSFPTSSTPNRSVFAKRVEANLDNSNAPASVNNSNLTHSINGADINRSYLEANKSDYSIKDLSLWFNQRRLSSLPPMPSLLQQNTMPINEGITANFNKEVTASNTDAMLRDTEMNNFKLLLHKVKEIVEDSYSDNTELSAATQNLENVLDSIIKCEETRRKST